MFLYITSWIPSLKKLHRLLGQLFSTKKGKGSPSEFKESL
jgi:hypothetical protein